MLVLFDTRVYYCITKYTLTEPSTNKKKRKRNSSSDTIYVLLDGEDVSTQIAVNAEHCTEIETKMDYSFCEAFETFLEKQIKPYDDDRYYLKCSYAINTAKTYYIQSIDKIMKDGILVTLRSDEIRHFKFDKLYIACGDGITQSCDLW